MMIDIGFAKVKFSHKYGGLALHRKVRDGE